MKFSDIKTGMLVSDTWFDNWGIGRVVTIKKTVVKIAFSGQTRTYDKPHVQFLQEAS